MLKRNLFLAACLAAATAFAADDAAPAPKHKPIPIAKLDRSTPVEFEKEVLPFLSTSCLACHNKSKPKGGLVLETPADIRKGGDNGAAVVPGKSSESELLKAAAHQAEEIMPPADNKVAAPNLTSEQLALLKLWIDQGATGEVKGAMAPVTWKALPETLQPIYAVAVSPDGQYAACGRGGQIFVYDVASGQLAATLTDPQLKGESAGKGSAHRDLVQSLTFSPDGSLLASGGYREIKIWSRPTPSKKADLPAAGAQTVVASPDGKWIAIPGGDGVLRLFDAATGKPAGELKGHEGAVLSAGFSPDGSKAVTGGADKSVRVWDVAERKQFVQADVGVQASAVAFAGGTGKQIAVGVGSAIKVFKLPAESSGAMTAGKDLKGHETAVNVLASVAGIEGQIVSGGEDGKVSLWNVETPAAVKTFAHGSAVYSVAARKDGKRIVSAGKENAAKLWDVDDPKKPVEIKGDRDKQQAVAIAERMATLAAGDVALRKTRVTDAEKSEKAAADRIKKAEEAAATGQKDLDAKKPKSPASDKKDEPKPTDKKDELKAGEKKAESEAEKEIKKLEQNLASLQDEVKQAHKSAEEAKQAVADAKTALKAAEDEQQARQSVVVEARKADAESAKPIRAVAFSADGGLIATVGDSGAVHTWSGQTGAPIAVFGERKAALRSVAAAGSNGIAILPAGSDTAALYDLAGSWALARTFGGSTDSASPLNDRVNAIAFTPDGKRLISGGGVPSRGGEIRVWDVAGGNVQKSLDDIHSDTVLAAEVSPDGKRLLTGSADRFVRITDLSTGKVIRSFEGHTHHVLGVSWKKDGRVVVSSGADNTVRFWDAETGDRKKPVAGFDKEVTAVSFLGDTDQAVCSSGDPKVRTVKDSGAGDKTFAGPTDFVHALATTPDGKIILAGGEDGVLRAWTADGKPIGTMK